MTSSQNDISDPILYRLYWSIILRDVLYNLGYDATRLNKSILHSFHKRVLKYNTTAGQSREIYSRFISEVLLLWAERGFFIRTKRDQPINIVDMELSKCWNLL
jgi:hypothetical protein